MNILKTKYSTVKESILSKILDGTYQPNQKISSESELMEEFGVSRHTVRLAIGDLVTEGWLYRKQGAGTFCAEQEGVPAADQSKNIAIVVTYISDYIFPSIIRGAEKYLSENGYQVSLFSTNNNHLIEKQILEKIISQNFAGIIFEPTKSAVLNPNINYYLNIESKGIPYIMIHAYYDELDPLSITVDDEKGGYLQTEHLIKLGHSNIAGFFKVDDLQGTKRMKGYIKAHREHRLVINPNYMVSYSSDNKDTKPAAELRKFLESSNPPTAIVCYNDELAVLLLEVLREKKLRVPEDISLVGFDNSYFARVFGLTTIRHPQSEIGTAAGKLIIQLANSPHKPQLDNKVESIVYEPELIIGDTTKELITK